MSAPLFQLRSISQRYGPREVLNLPALDIPADETLALVGPSGAGKSTLLRLLNFLETPGSGTIAFDGAQVPAVAPLALRRQITTVFQRPALLSASVLANVAYGLHLRGVHNTRQPAMAALEQVGLAHLASKAARTLSGGEMQRVALARALVLTPRVLLLDEPTANLDPANVQVIERAIADLRAAGSTTVVLVTHNLFQARRLADRVALLLDGRLAEFARTDDFFERPRDPRAAAFVRGEMVY